MNRNPIITIDTRSPSPAYRQIVDAMRHLLVEGTLQPGDQVPPVRQLALDLGVHFNTVALAYRALAEEGWLDLKRRRGALVVDRAKPAAPPRAHQQDSLKRLRELTAKLRSEGIPSSQIVSHLRKLAEGIEGE